MSKAPAVLIAWSLNPRLRRLEHVFGECPVYFVTAGTFQRGRWLADAKVHAAFRHFAQIAETRGVCIGRYVLMPDHLHLFVCFPPNEAGALSSWMKSLKNALSAHLRRAGVLAPHWQKGFFDHVLRSGESYSQKWDYVAQNPVRAGLVKSAEEWPYQGEIFPLPVE